MRRIALVFLLSAGCCIFTQGLANAQYTSESPATLEPGRYEFISSVSSAQIDGKETQTLPGMKLRYGVVDNVQIEAWFGVTSMRLAKTPRYTGASDTFLMAKWRFINETKNDPQVGIAYQIKLPTADKPHKLGTGNVDNKFWLTAQKSMKRWKTWGYLGYNFQSGTSGVNYPFYGWAINNQVTETIIIGAEIVGNQHTVPKKNGEFIWSVCGRWNYVPDRSLLVKFGRSEKGTSDMSLYLGHLWSLK